MKTNRMTYLSLLGSALLLFCGETNAQDCTFTNPIKEGNSPDPHVVYKDGYYIGCFTTGGDIRIWRNQNLENIFQGESQSVWNQGNDIWAPEIHYLNGKWYIYSTRNTGSFWMNTFILESHTQDPLGGYTLVADLPELGNTLDANVWQDPTDGQIYMAYSRLDDQMGEGQELWLTKMSNPYTPEGTPMLLSYPEYDWEKEYGAVNEGPAFLVKGDKVHVVYSASQTHYEGYKLGRLTATLGSDLMNPASWTKHPEPVFQKSVANGVYAPGHHSTLETPGGEWWIIYHAKYEHNKNTVGAARDARMQQFSFDANNYPVFGEPVAAGVALACPDSGDGGQGVVPDGTYRLKNRQNARVADVEGMGTGDGSNVHLWDWHGGTNQRWDVTHLGGNQYSIIGVGSGKAIDVEAASTADWANIHIWTYFGGDNQKWIVEPTDGGYHQLTAVHSGKVLDASGGDNGSNIHQFTWHGGANQQWTFQAP